MTFRRGITKPIALMPKIIVAQVANSGTVPASLQSLDPARERYCGLNKGRLRRCQRRFLTKRVPAHCLPVLAQWGNGFTCNRVGCHRCPLVRRKRNGSFTAKRHSERLRRLVGRSVLAIRSTLSIDQLK